MGRWKGGLRRRGCTHIAQKLTQHCKAMIVQLKKKNLKKQKNLPVMQETWVLSLGQEEPCSQKWQPTPVFLPGEFQVQRRLVGYSSWDCRVGHDWATFSFTFQWKIKIDTFLCTFLCIYTLSEEKKFSHLLVAMVVLLHITWKVCERQRLLREMVTFS